MVQISLYCDLIFFCAFSLMNSNNILGCFLSLFVNTYVLQNCLHQNCIFIEIHMARLQIWVWLKVKVSSELKIPMNQCEISMPLAQFKRSHNLLFLKVTTCPVFLETRKGFWIWLIENIKVILNAYCRVEVSSGCFTRSWRLILWRRVYLTTKSLKMVCNFTSMQC